jgi:hypothetical protein
MAVNADLAVAPPRRAQNEVPDHWVSESETPVDSEYALLLSPDLAVLAGKIGDIRSFLNENTEQSEAWRTEASRMLAALFDDVPGLLHLGSSRAARTKTASAQKQGVSPGEWIAVNATPTPVEATEFRTLADYRLVANAAALEGNWSQKVVSFGVPSNTWLTGYSSLSPTPIAAVTLSAPTTPRAVRAFQEIRDILGVSDRDAADAVGVGRTTPYTWIRGREPRPSTVRQLYEVHALLMALLRRLGWPQLQQWLNTEREAESTPLNQLVSGDLGAFRRTARAALFGPRDRRKVPSLLPDADVDLAAAGSLQPTAKRRGRRRLD